MTFMGIATKEDLKQINKNAAVNYNNHWENHQEIKKLRDRVCDLEYRESARKKPKRSVK